MKSKFIRFSFALFLIFGTSKAFAQNADAIIGKWYNTEKDAQVEITKENGKYSGKIVWLAEPTENGKPKVDKNNSDKSKRTRPIMGMKLLNGFEFSKGVWEDGTIYDPKNGKTYSCIIKMKDDKTLEVRGYIGISFVGRTVKWTKVQ